MSRNYFCRKKKKNVEFTEKIVGGTVAIGYYRILGSHPPFLQFLTPAPPLLQFSLLSVVAGGGVLLPTAFAPILLYQSKKIYETGI